MVPPGVLGDQVLEIGGHVGGTGDCPVDVPVAEHLAPYRHSRATHILDGPTRRLRNTHLLGDEAGDPVRGFGGCQVADTVEHDEVTVLDTGGDAPQ